MTRSFHINRHPQHYSNFVNPEEEAQSKELVDKTYQAIRAICSDDDYLITSVIMSLITKHTNTMATDEVLEYDKNNEYKPDHDLVDHLDSIAQGLPEIAQLVLHEKINFKKMIQKTKRNAEKLME